MSHYKTIQALGTPVVLHSNLTKFLGSITASAFLSHIMYWSDKTDNALGVYKSCEQITDETGLSKKEQMTARKILRELGLIVETHKRLEHRLYYRFEPQAFDAWFEANLAKCQKASSPSAKNERPEVPKGNFGENPNGTSLYTKITTKNTTKITTESEYAPTHESEQTHFADEKNSQEPSANKATSSAKKSTTAKKYLTADDLVNLTLADCKFTQKDFENYPNLGEWIFADMDYQVASDYLAMRSSKNELTLTAIKMSIKEASIAGLTLCQALEVCITSGKSGWLTFKAQWYANRQQKPTWQQNPTAFANQPNPDRKSELEALATQFADDFYQSGYPGQNVIDITPNGDYS